MHAPICGGKLRSFPSYNGVRIQSLSYNDLWNLKPDSIYKAWLRKGISYPPYMMQLYQSLTMGNVTDLSGLEHLALQESDTVLSLSARSWNEIGDRWMISFDMSSISISAELNLVELRVSFPPFHETHTIRVEIYHSKEGQDMVFMGSFTTISTISKHESWKIFNLTRMMQNFINQGEPDLSVEYVPAEVQELNRSSGQSPQLNTEPLAGSYFPSDRAMLVVFAREKLTTTLSGSPSLIKIVKTSKYIRAEKTTKGNVVKRHRRHFNSTRHMLVNGRQARTKEVGAPFCRRVDMWVDFDKFEWGDQVVFPKTYNAYRCEGECPVPLNENFQATNHAYMKSLVKYYGSDKVECASCVPVKMSAISMFVYEDHRVAKMNHEQMVVDECGCA
ncbi:nodal homolog 2-A-like [Leptodactylus fuscus]|uniref:nodal homolog 2-A-like n=1 Tax=Leptodactylus fuscus TaxID=238119 RepID=UPI003F4EAD10